MTKRIGKEAHALWAEVYGAPPKDNTDPAALLQRLVEGLPPVGYERFTTPALDDAGLVWPRADDRIRNRRP